MYAFYVVRGHTLEYLEGLSATQKMFYTIAMESYYERISNFIGGDETDKKELERQFNKMNI